jgi:CHAT domain-containing protein
MTRFYEALRHPERPLDKAHAMRQAMRLTKAAHPRPEDWAAFVLLGEPR